ncbi:MAG: M20/M25/M40 family metallo-hydrolase [Planctomycetales bacterium]|nr:M20/M25/M40 family metallo-hydrolase [Planctomycetales bacterium]
MAERKSITKSESVGPTASSEKLLMELLAIPGKSGEEGACAKFICDQLMKAGAKESWIRFDSAHKKTPIAGQVGNLIVKIPGATKAPRRMLMAHMDTVPICVGCRPVKKGSMVQSADPSTGLGADNRAGVAVTLLAALEILKHGLKRPPLTFLWTIQEEIGLHGARLVSLGSLGKPTSVFNWDGGSPSKLTIGATGGYRMQIDIAGKASHAGNAPEKGVSAIAIASLAVADLHENGWHGDIRKNGKAGTSNVGVFRGGDATNVVTERVSIRAEARSHDSKFRERIVREIEKAFQNAAKRVTSVDGHQGHVTFDGRLDYDSFCLKTDEPTVQLAGEAVRSIGLEPELAIANGGLDANWLSARGLPTVSFGCGQLNQHMTSEALNLEQFEQARQIALRLATATESQREGR